ncbi:MAG: cyclic nucleotide-binding domain-containing protein [Cyclobacteriaceae bacterium]|nr:cyclic nucleotide-binding domain-containing protein [Cyclobacteriaceae bacterium]
MINPFRKVYSDKELQLFDYLKELVLFNNMTDKELSAFIPHLYERTYVKDEVVFFRNDPSHALYLLRKGKVSLNLDINDNMEELLELSGVSSFGENCILPGTKRPMNAVVTSDEAWLYVIPKENIMLIMEGNPQIKTKLVETYALISEKQLKKLFKHYRISFGMFNIKDIYNV